MELYIGGLSPTIQGERLDLSGKIMFSSFFEPGRDGLYQLDYRKVDLFLDSGAFQRVKTGARIDNSEVLDLQYKRETQISQRVGMSVQAIALASNDLLIDEKWIGDRKVKQRWSVEDGELAIKETVAAARFLASQDIGDRVRVLGCQGVNASQYKNCVDQVLEFATDKDWIGMGGWCILGKQQKWMPTFRETLIQVVPAIAQSKVKHVHIYGVLFEPALGNLLWMCDRYNLSLSTDSKKPLSDCRWKTSEQMIQAGARRLNWKDNVDWWRNNLAGLRNSAFYKSPYCGSTTKSQSKRQYFQLSMPLL